MSHTLGSRLLYLDNVPEYRRSTLDMLEIMYAHHADTTVQRGIIFGVELHKSEASTLLEGGSGMNRPFLFRDKLDALHCAK